MASSPREDNRVPALVAKSDADNTPVIIEADPVTKRLKVNATITNGAVTDGGSVVSSVNSSIVILTSGSTFTGTGEIVTTYSSVTVAVKSDVASATDGLQLQQSSDNSNWDIVDSYTIPAATGKTFGVQITGKYFRVVYTNGGTNQASFRLWTMYHQYMPNASSVRPQDGRSNENDMQEVIGYGSVFNGNSWDRFSGGNRFADGSSATGSALTAPLLYNGSSFDRYRSNTAGVIVAAGTTTTQSVTTITYNAKQAAIIINVSAYTSGTINIAINLLSSSGYSYSPFASIVGLAAAGTVIYRIGPGLTPVAGLTANDILARSLQVITSGTFVATYGIDVNLGI